MNNSSTIVIFTYRNPAAWWTLGQGRHCSRWITSPPTKTRTITPTSVWMGRTAPASSAASTTVAPEHGAKTGCMSEFQRSIPTHEYSSPPPSAFSTWSTGSGICTYKSSLEKRRNSLLLQRKQVKIFVYSLYLLFLALLRIRWKGGGCTALKFKARVWMGKIASSHQYLNSSLCLYLYYFSRWWLTDEGSRVRTGRDSGSYPPAIAWC